MAEAMNAIGFSLFPMCPLLLSKRGVDGLRQQQSPSSSGRRDTAASMGPQDTEQISSMSANGIIPRAASRVPDSNLEDDERDDALMEEAELMEQDLPDNLAEVEDSKWPIFVTFEKLTSMVEGMLASRGTLCLLPFKHVPVVLLSHGTCSDISF